jgi:hypothetical protein
VKIVLESLGAAPLIAEYDAERRTIRVNARMVEQVRSRFGEAAARELIACAVAHEWSHVLDPGAGEKEAHARVREVTGCDPRDMEALVRRAALH